MKNILKTKAPIAAVCLLIAATTTIQAEDAKVIWEKNCASCHGKDGKGNTKMGKKVDVKDYTDAKNQADLTDEKAVKTIKEGIKDDKGKERMKPYGELLSDDEVKSMVAYVRAFKN